MPTYASQRIRRARRHERNVRHKRNISRRRLLLREQENTNIEECFDQCQDQGYHLDPDVNIGVNPGTTGNWFAGLTDEEVPSFKPAIATDFDLHAETPRISASSFDFSSPSSTRVSVPFFEKPTPISPRFSGSNIALSSPLIPPTRLTTNIPSPLLYHKKSRDEFPGLDDEHLDLAKTFSFSRGSDPCVPDFENYNASSTDLPVVVTESRNESCYSPTCNMDLLCYSIACPGRLKQQEKAPITNHHEHFVGAALPTMGLALIKRDVVNEAAEQARRRIAAFHQRTWPYRPSIAAQATTLEEDAASSPSTMRFCSFKSGRRDIVTNYYPAPVEAGPLRILWSPIWSHQREGATVGSPPMMRAGDTPNLDPLAGLWTQPVVCDDDSDMTTKTARCELVFPKYDPMCLVRTQALQLTRKPDDLALRQYFQDVLRAFMEKVSDKLEKQKEHQTEVGERVFDNYTAEYVEARGQDLVSEEPMDGKGASLITEEVPEMVQFEDEEGGGWNWDWDSEKDDETGPADEDVWSCDEHWDLVVDYAENYDWEL